VWKHPALDLLRVAVYDDEPTTDNDPGQPDPVGIYELNYHTSSDGAEVTEVPQDFVELHERNEKEV
jgi:hypothetical protein